MKKLALSLVICTPLFLLTGCATVETVSVGNVVYDPGYSNDYVYSVGYYNNRPYWGNNYYYYTTGYNYGTNGYWGGGGYYNGY